MVNDQDATSSGDAQRKPATPRSSRLVVTLVVVLLALVALKGYSWLFPAPPVPIPRDLQQLQPQLRDYLTLLIDQTRAVPRKFQSHATLGIAYAANQLWPEARRCFENAAKLAPQEPLAHLYVGISTEELGNSTEALRIYREITDRFPTFPQAFFRLGKLLLQNGAIGDAERAFTRLAELAPGEWRAHAGLGEIALRRSDHAQAATHLEKAIALDPTAGNARSLLGLAYRGLGRNEDAEFELARGVDSRNYPMPDAWGDTAHEHMRLVQDQLEIANRLSLDGASDRAIGMLGTAASYSPTNLALLNALAVVLNRAQRPAEAQNVLNRLFAHNDGYLPGLITASLVARELGQLKESLAFARRAVMLAPDSAHAHVALANALLAAELDAEAVVALQTATRLDPKNAELHLQFGDVLLINLNRPEEALQHYGDACKLSPTLVSAQIRLARMQIEQGNLIEADKTLAKSRKLEPANPALPLLEEQLRSAVRAEESQPGLGVDHQMQNGDSP